MIPGQTFEATVRDLSTQEGNGVFEGPEGRVFFCKGVWPGDRGLFEIESIKKRYGFAKLVKLLEPSNDRRGDRPCEYHGFSNAECGGCPWLFVNYEAQLKAKEHKVRHSLERARLLSSNCAVHSILASPNEWSYRNRAQFKADGVNFGFVAPESKHIVDVEKCPILNVQMQHLLTELRKEKNSTKFHPATGFIWNYCDVDDSQEVEDVVVNQRRPFKQGNELQNQKMKEWIRKRLCASGASSSHTVAVELFCGSGNFTEDLAAAGISKTIAVEFSEASLCQLKEKKLKGVETLALNLFHPAAIRELQRGAPEASLLLLDPPREGMLLVGDLVKKLKKLQTILYVSCDVSSFVRDTRNLVDQGFALAEVQPLDLFPQTPHVEVLARFERSYAD